MKKPVLLFSILIAGAATFTSCNKNLKDDIKDLKNQVDTLKKHNSELQEQVNGIESALGSNEPIAVTSTFVDDNNTTRTIKEVYKFKSSGAETQSLRENGDGTYDIYIERFSDVEWYEGAWVAFTYNPTSKAITNKRGGHYWSDMDSYGDRTRFDEVSYGGAGLTITITVNNINLATGEISLSFAASGTGAYTNTIHSYYCPNQGQPMSTSFSFTGKLKLFPHDDE